MPFTNNVSYNDYTDRIYLPTKKSYSYAPRIKPYNIQVKKTDNFIFIKQNDLNINCQRAIANAYDVRHTCRESYAPIEENFPEISRLVCAIK